MYYSFRRNFCTNVQIERRFSFKRAPSYSGCSVGSGWHRGDTRRTDSEAFSSVSARVTWTGGREQRACCTGRCRQEASGARSETRLRAINAASLFIQYTLQTQPSTDWMLLRTPAWVPSRRIADWLTDWMSLLSHLTNRRWNYMYNA